MLSYPHNLFRLHLTELRKIIILTQRKMTKEKSSPSSEDRNKYEVMVIFRPDAGEEGVIKNVKDLKDLIGEAGGDVFYEDNWGSREMAYKIKGQEVGYYYVINFNLLPNKLKKIEKHLKLEKEVLRHMILRVPEKYEVKSLQSYTEEDAKAVKEEQAARAAKTKPGAIQEKPVQERKAKPKVETKTEEVKTEETTKEEKPKAEKKAEKVEEKTKKTELDELDAKLQSIINDSDIIL